MEENKKYRINDTEIIVEHAFDVYDEAAEKFTDTAVFTISPGDFEGLVDSGVSQIEINPTLIKEASEKFEDVEYIDGVHYIYMDKALVTESS